MIVREWHRCMLHLHDPLEEKGLVKCITPDENMVLSMETFMV